MPIDFYLSAGSPPCRSIQMVATAVGVELNEIAINTQAKEHLTPEFLKMNPQHTIPTIKDGDFCLWESRAILGYLANKYGNDELYPKDPAKRAVVDQRLYFDMGLYQRFADYGYPQMMAAAPADPEKYKKLLEGYEFLNTFLEGQKYSCGDKITIADCALMATVSTFVDSGTPFTLEKYPNVQRWYEDCKVNVPGYQRTVAGMEMYRSFFSMIGLPKEE